MKFLRRIYFLLFKRYHRLEYRLMPVWEADKLIHETSTLSETERWVIAIPEEDSNRKYSVVHMCRQIRITE